MKIRRFGPSRPHAAPLARAADTRHRDKAGSAAHGALSWRPAGHARYRWARRVAVIVAALIASGTHLAQAQGTGPMPAAVAADRSETAAGPGLIVRSWRSATDLQAWQGDGHWRLALSPVSHHFRYSAEHRYVWAFGAERQRPDDWLAGFSYFRNSFGQHSAYAYVGKRFGQLFGEPKLFGQLSGGILYGYTGKYQRKVPLNVAGFSPGALVSAGWQFTPRFAVTAHMLGDAGMMLQLSYELN